MFANTADVPLPIGRPPAGAVNVYIGTAIEGPGGRWVPCVSLVGREKYLPAVFETGPGRHQVCADIDPLDRADDALSIAIALAETAAD